MRKPRELKVRHYVDSLIGLNKYLSLFPGVNMADKIGVTDIKEIFFNIIPNSWIEKEYVQVFY